MKIPRLQGILDNFKHDLLYFDCLYLFLYIILNLVGMTMTVIVKIGGGQRARTGKLLEQENQKLTLLHPQLSIEPEAEIQHGQRKRLPPTDAKDETVNEAVGTLNVERVATLDIIAKVDPKNPKKRLVAVVKAKNPKIKHRNKKLLFGKNFSSNLLLRLHIRQTKILNFYKIVKLKLHYRL